MPCFRSVAVLLLGTALATAGDWPQWLGPQRDGGSPDVISAWKETPKVLWRDTVGEGHSSPVVADGKVYLHVKVKDKERGGTHRLRRRQGRRTVAHELRTRPFKSVFGAGPRGTPAVADGKVYTFGVTGLLTCFDAARAISYGRLIRSRSSSATNLFFGASSSPIVEGDNVIVNVGGKGASIVAFKQGQGRDRPGRHSTTRRAIRRHSRSAWARNGRSCS